MSSEKAEHANRDHRERGGLKRLDLTHARSIERLLGDKIGATASGNIKDCVSDDETHRRRAVDAHNDKDRDGAGAAGQRERVVDLNTVVEHIERHHLPSARGDENDGPLVAVVRLDALCDIVPLSALRRIANQQAKRSAWRGAIRGEQHGQESRAGRGAVGERANNAADIGANRLRDRRANSRGRRVRNKLAPRRTALQPARLAFVRRAVVGECPRLLETGSARRRRQLRQCGVVEILKRHLLCRAPANQQQQKKHRFSLCVTKQQICFVYSVCEISYICHFIAIGE